MTQSSWPFHNGTSGTPVLEDQWSIMARTWSRSGVLDYGDELEVSADGSARSVAVAAGRASVRGHWYESDASEVLTISANTSGNPRIDRIVLQLDPSADEIVLAVLTGTPASSPSAPTLTQTDTGVYEISLAQVAVADSAAVISAGNVTDERTIIGAAVSSAGDTMSGALAMGSNKITGLAAATVSGDAVRFDEFDALGEWTTYTPSLSAHTTAPTGWTSEGWYTQIGSLVIAKFHFTAGAGMTGGSGGYRFGIPVAAATTLTWTPVGQVVCRDNSTANEAMLPLRMYGGGTGFVVSEFPTAWPSGSLTNVAASVPWTWAPGDEIRGLVTYEAA